MNRKFSVILVATVPGMLLPSLAAAQQFSADQVIRDNTGQLHKGKVYVANGKLRLEPTQDGRPNTPDFLLADLSTQLEDMVFSAQHTYIEQSGPIVLQTTRYFHVGDPCQRNPGGTGTGTCKKLGTEIMNGRTTEKWQFTDTWEDGKTATFYEWIDRELNAIVREQALGSDIQLQNINEAPQPASLFELPAGYRKMVVPNRPGRPSH
jgi:hypothetical protein